ncbi:MAG: NlpC/P60 family protein [Pseudomonadota bacterium]
MRRVIQPYADLCRQPGWPRDRQLLFGAEVVQLSVQDGFAYVQNAKDGYVGYITATHLGAPSLATHRISAPATTLYADPDFRTPDLGTRFHGSQLNVKSKEGRFLETAEGFLPVQHAVPIDHYDSDPAAVAALYFGTPYLWGGNTRAGIDCSGLVQAALHACGAPCPADSDMQQFLGEAVMDGSYEPNDLLFWKGHVALISDPETLIHANAGAMATVYEPIDAAIKRIAAQGDGQPTAHRRLTLPPE